MKYLLLQRISFPQYDTVFLLDICYELAKFRNIIINEEDSTIKFFHHYQKLVVDSRNNDSMDPYPIKHVGNLKVLVEALAEMMKQQSQNLNRVMKQLNANRR